MDNELYLIHLSDYLDHIDHKLSMYDLLLELVRAVRDDLDTGEFSQAVRTLCSYEQKAHEMYENWCIPDEYAESGDPDDLAQLMEDELLPCDDDWDDDMDDGDPSPAVRLLRAVDQLTSGARTVLEVANEIVEFEEKIDRLMDSLEKPENDCAD
jgi:hypothetical protein